MELVTRDLGFLPFAKLSDVPPGRMKAAELEGVPILVVNLDGRLRAVKDQCPHQNTPLRDGSIRGTAVQCRQHAWKFDLETGEYLDIPRIKVRTYDVKVDGDQILVRVVKEEWKV